MPISGWSSDVCASDLAQLNAVTTTQGRFTKPEQFESIILRANPDGSAVKLGDVGRVELGAASYLFSSELNGKQMSSEDRPGETEWVSPCRCRWQPED